MGYMIAPGPLTRREASDVLLRRGRDAIEAGHLQAACARLRRAIAVDSANFAARVQLVDCLVDRRRFRGASRVAETAYLLARNAGDLDGAGVCLNRIVALQLRGTGILDARRLLQQAIRTELDQRGALSALTLVNLSRAMRGSWSLARRWRLLKGGLRIAKGSERIEALLQNGRLFFEGEDMEGALRAFEEARRVAVRIKTPPGRMAAVLSDQGLALVRTRRYAAAVGVLRSAAQLHARVGNRRWAWKLSALAQRVLNAQRRVDEIVEGN